LYKQGAFWDDSSNKSVSYMVFKFTKSVTVSNASGNFASVVMSDCTALGTQITTSLNGDRSSGTLFTVRCTGSYGAPSSGLSSSMSGTFSWTDM
jgi:hypothetical protein